MAAVVQYWYSHGDVGCTVVVVAFLKFGFTGEEFNAVPSKGLTDITKYGIVLYGSGRANGTESRTV